eukprot:11410918-Alexandrium_andersonii.AAC.1
MGGDTVVKWGGTELTNRLRRRACPTTQNSATEAIAQDIGLSGSAIAACRGRGTKAGGPA